MKGKRSIKLSTKIALSALFAVLFIGAIVSIAGIMQISRGLLDSSRQHAMGIAKVAASQIDGAVFASLSHGDEESDGYKLIFDTLASFKEDEDVEYIYSMRMHDGELHFVVDTDTEEGASIGESYEAYDKIEEALAGAVTADDEMTTDEWGSFYSAFAPIYDGNTVVGIVGVDCSVGDINAHIWTVKKQMLILCLICVIPCMVLSVLVGRLTTRNVKVINNKMDELALSDGDLTHQLTIKSGDEIGQMASSFNQFMNKLKTMMLSVKDNEMRLNDVTADINKQVEEAVRELDDIVSVFGEMTRSMNETSNGITEIVSVAGDVQELSTTVYEQARTQEENASRIKDRADDICKKSGETKERVSQMTVDIADTLAKKIEDAAKVEQIKGLTEQIIAISDETSILALNASIEAARAGEHGKGFAVVADEIGKLASGTAATANQIVELSTLIVKAVSELADAANSMIDFMKGQVQADYESLVEVGTSYSADAGQFMAQMKEFSELSGSLNDDMKRIEEHITQIMAVVEEETASIASVTETAENINEKMQTLHENSRVGSAIVDDLDSVLSRFTM